MATLLLRLNGIADTGLPEKVDRLRSETIT